MYMQSWKFQKKITLFHYKRNKKKLHAGAYLNGSDISSAQFFPIFPIYPVGEFRNGF